MTPTGSRLPSALQVSSAPLVLLLVDADLTGDIRSTFRANGRTPRRRILHPTYRQCLRRKPSIGSWRHLSPRASG
ncbi:hypothetical protein EDB19DRAFT_1667044 [Suillus lakei]|nr:hypothetical protein EDB19DRAFT_1667044 [Suillus lakei]